VRTLSVIVPATDRPATLDSAVHAIEGATILARARRSTEPLDTVERYFAARPPASEA
jgi:hypothetical protein